MAKFTFKKTIHEGRYRSFEKDHTAIKLDKKEVGYIQENLDGSYRISLAVKQIPTKENPAPFRWIHLKKKSKSEKEARELIKRGEAEIQRIYDLYQFED